MTKRLFSTAWKKSTQRRKQRKYRYNAPLHIRQKFLHVHLTPALREKHGLRNTLIRKGDKIRVLRGYFRKKEGTVERVLLKKERVFVSGLTSSKKDGAKLPVAFRPSQLLITELTLGDRRRKEKIERKSEGKEPREGKKWTKEQRKGEKKEENDDGGVS